MDTRRQVAAISESIESPIGKSINTLDWFGKNHDTLTMYTDARRAFAGSGSEGELAVAFAALTLAISFAPGIGGAYVDIIKKIPGLVEDWREFINDYKLRYDSPNAFLRIRERQSRKPRRAVCGNSL